jgi:hypothetical protein
MDARDVCARLGYEPDPPAPDSRISVAQGALEGRWPLHALRHPVVGTQNGWYVWSGELSDAEDFFAPMHVEHLAEKLPAIVPYLWLPPGSRVLLAPDYEDVWEDPSLLLDDSAR